MTTHPPLTRIDLVDGRAAVQVLTVIEQAFGDRPALDPPATAMDETIMSLTESLDEHGGLLATFDGRPVGTLLFRPFEGKLGVRRVGVVSDVRHLGVAQQLAEVAELRARSLGYPGLVLEARAELPKTVRFWQRLGYAEVSREGPKLRMVRMLPFSISLPEAEDTRALGQRLGGLLRAGDLVVLSGDLGAGKTTFTQGLAEGLAVRGPITSPTFVIARVHPSLAEGPALVHVDAYRLGDSLELDDLDLDTDLDSAVTVVEWGTGLAEALNDSRLEVHLARGETVVSEDAPDVRTATLTPVGPRWVDADLSTQVVEPSEAPAEGVPRPGEPSGQVVKPSEAPAEGVRSGQVVEPSEAPAEGVPRPGVPSGRVVELSEAPAKGVPRPGVRSGRVVEPAEAPAEGVPRPGESSGSHG